MSSNFLIRGTAYSKPKNGKSLLAEPNLTIKQARLCILWASEVLQPSQEAVTVCWTRPREGRACATEEMHCSSYLGMSICPGCIMLTLRTELS